MAEQVQTKQVVHCLFDFVVPGTLNHGSKSLVFVEDLEKFIEESDDCILLSKVVQNVFLDPLRFRQLGAERLFIASAIDE